MNHLKVWPFGVAGGVLWALYIFTIGITAMFGWGVGLVAPFATLYLGFAPSVLGAVIGGLWAFVDGFIAGVVFAWIYNLLAK